MNGLVLTFLLLALHQDPQEEPRAPIQSETLKTLIDKVKDKVTICDGAIKNAGNVLSDFEKEVSSRTLGDIDFRCLADGIGAARASITEAVKDADALVKRLDHEILDSMLDGERFIFKGAAPPVEPEKAQKMTEVMRIILDVYDATPEGVSRSVMELMADQLDRTLSGENLQDLLDMSALGEEIVVNLIVYRNSLCNALQTLQELDMILAVLEGKSRDLANLMMRDAKSHDKTATARAVGLIREIKESREKALTIFRKLGKKIRDVKRTATPEGETELAGKKKIDALREKYSKSQ